MRLNLEFALTKSTAVVNQRADTVYVSQQKQSDGCDHELRYDWALVEFVLVVLVVLHREQQANGDVRVNYHKEDEHGSPKALSHDVQ